MPSSSELIEVSSNEGEIELDQDEQEPAEEVGENEHLEEEVVGHESDPEDEDSKMQDFDSGEEDDDSSDLNYDPSWDG